MIVGSGASLTATGSGMIAASTLAANGTNCTAGSFPLGVDAAGAAESCTALPTTIAGTTNQIAVSAATGPVTISIPTNPTLPGTTTGTFSGNLTGNVSGSATALAANAANCTAGQFATGVDASGAAEGCTALPTTIAGTTNQITASAATGAVTLAIANNPILPGTTTGTFSGSLTGNISGTATALAANGGNCTAGQFASGVDASGVAEGCTALPTTITGTTNQIAASAATGPVTLSIPNNPTLPGTTTGNFSGPLTGNVNGNATTATALAANGANCSVAGTFPNGVDASGVAENCVALSSANAQTTTYQVLAADFDGYKTIAVASGTFTITLVASGSQPANGKYIRVINYGSGTVTIARSGQNINGGTTSLTLPAGSATDPAYAFILSDGTHYLAAVVKPTSQVITTLATSTTYTCPGPVGSSAACEMQMTGVAGTVTIAAPTGTPKNGDMLLFGLLCTNAQTLSWDTVFVASVNVAIPTSCPANVTQWLQVGARYSTVLSKWQVLASN